MKKLISILSYRPNFTDYFFIAVCMMIIFPVYTFVLIPAIIYSNDARRLRVDGWKSAAEVKGKFVSIT